jgi:hypothetical protein
MSGDTMITPGVIAAKSAPPFCSTWLIIAQRLGVAGCVSGLSRQD